MKSKCNPRLGKFNIHSPMYGMIQSLKVAIPIDPNQPTAKIFQKPAPPILLKVAIVANALKRTCNGWKTSNRLSEVEGSTLKWERNAKITIPITAPANVSGE